MFTISRVPWNDLDNNFHRRYFSEPRSLELLSICPTFGLVANAIPSSSSRFTFLLSSIRPDRIERTNRLAFHHLPFLRYLSSVYVRSVRARSSLGKCVANDKRITVYAFEYCKLVRIRVRRAAADASPSSTREPKKTINKKKKEKKGRYLKIFRSIIRLQTVLLHPIHSKHQFRILQYIIFYTQINHVWDLIHLITPEWPIASVFIREQSHFVAI